MRPSVRIEAHRQTMLGENLFQRPEGRSRAFLFNKERRADRPCRTVQGHNPGRAGARCAPCAAPWRRSSSTEGAAWSRCSPSRSRGPSPDAKVLDREAMITLAIERLHLLRPVARNPLARCLASRRSTSRSHPSSSARPPPKCPLAHSENSPLPPGSPPPIPNGAEDSKHRHMHPLKRFHPPQSTPPKKAQTYRENRALPKPVISSASDIAPIAELPPARMAARLLSQEARSHCRKWIGGSRSGQQWDGRTSMARFLRGGEKPKGQVSAWTISCSS
jgi:hypothetical protein